ncbi:MAG: NAD-dependent deacylase [Bacteroidota bacterium]
MMAADQIPTALVDRLRSARRVAVLTGAGVSAESGIPTFRDALDGLWSRFDPRELATPDAFIRHPARVQAWYRHRDRLVDACAPNPAHETLTDFYARFETFSLITQNVDGLHRRAGSEAAVRLHGSLNDWRCFACARPAPPPDVRSETDVPGRCPICRGLLRPGVVWFGEPLPPDELDRAMEAAATADVFLSVGTSGEVYPAAGLPEMARQQHAFVAEINPQATPLSAGMDAVIRLPAGRALPAIARALDS